MIALKSKPSGNGMAVNTYAALALSVMKRNSRLLEFRFSIGGVNMSKTKIGQQRNFSLPVRKTLYLKVAISFVASFCMVYLLSSSLVISLIFGFLLSTTAFLISRQKSHKDTSAMNAAWPEVIDHLVSGIQSGLSITESLIGLTTRGPLILRPYFAEFELKMRMHGDFNLAISELKQRCAQHSSDQIFEAIAISKTLGGSELLNILRTVGTFLRQDLALRREIEVKHGWIKNSAHLSAAAPWLLLLLLSTQPATSRAFSTPTGVLILLIGLSMTAIAYVWMNRLGRLPELPRVFGSA
jgi:tight adherence protein B